MTSTGPLKNKGVHKKMADELQHRQKKDNAPRENNLNYGYTMLKLELEVTTQEILKLTPTVL